MLQGKGAKTSEVFFVNAGDFKAIQEIELMVEFPTSSQQDKMNDISMYFKIFTTFLLATHPSLSILNWDNPKQTPIKK